MKKYECKECKKKLTNKTKTGLCRKCWYDYKSKNANYKCNHCDKIIGYTKSGLCRECLKIENAKHKRKCSKCGGKISNDNKGGVCEPCLKIEREKNYRYCVKCKTNRLIPTNKSGYCWTCNIERLRSLRTKCETCSRFVSNGQTKCKRCIDKELNPPKPKIIKPKRYCSDCDKQIHYNNKSGLCRSCSLKKRKGEIRVIKKYCLDCGKELSSGVKGKYCWEHRLLHNKPKPVKCANKECNNMVENPRERKYCSTICMYEGRKQKTIEKLKKEGRYEEYLEKIEKRHRPKVRICKKHNTKITSEMGCIKCSMEKQQLEEQKRIKNGWKKCGVCGSNWVMKSRTKCRSCIEKSFKERKAKGLLN